MQDLEQLSQTFLKRLQKLIKGQTLTQYRQTPKELVLGIAQNKCVDILQELGKVLGEDKDQFGLEVSTHIPNIVPSMTISDANRDPRTIQEISADQQQLHLEADYPKVIMDYLAHPQVYGILIEEVSTYVGESHVLFNITLSSFAKHRNGALILLKVVKKTTTRRGRSSVRGK